MPVPSGYNGRATNIARGGGAYAKPQLIGLKNAQRRLMDLLPTNPQIAVEANKVVSDAGAMVADVMRHTASAAGWPKSVVDTIFSTKKQAPSSALIDDRPHKITALAGINKQRSMVKWRAGRNPKSPRAKKKPGQMVEESKAEMLEIGTTIAPARPAIREAVQIARPGVVEEITKGFTAIYTRITGRA